MAATELTLSDEEQTSLTAIAQQTGKTEAEVIHEAVMLYIQQYQQQSRQYFLQQARGMWRERDDLPDFQSLRSSWDRQQLEP